MKAPKTNKRISQNSVVSIVVALIGAIATILNGYLQKEKGISEGLEIATEEAYITIQNEENQIIKVSTDELLNKYNDLLEKYNVIVAENSTTQTDNLSNSSKKIYLNNIEYFNYQHTGFPMSYETWDEYTDKDLLGNTYTNALKFSVTGLGEGNYVFLEYFLDSKYSSFEGAISVLQESRATKGKTIFIVYGDDEIIYKTSPFGPETLPIEFNINVTGVKKLKIELLSQSVHENWKVGIYEPTLS